MNTFAKAIIVGKYFLATRHTRKFSDREKLEKYQIKKIDKQLRFLRRKSPLYARMIGNNTQLCDLPIANKTFMMDNFNTLNTVGVDCDEALAIAVAGEQSRNFGEKCHDITVGLSSGTSGNRGMFILSDRDQCLWLGTILAKMVPRNKLFGQRIAFFLRANNNLYEKINSVFMKLKYYDIQKPLETFVEDINKFAPTFLAAPPSVLIQLADMMNCGIMQIRPYKIISIAEVLEQRDEDFIKKAFNQNSIHQIYQCTEGFLGCTCEYGNLHLNEDMVYVEREYLDKNRFVPVITDFQRQAQPIIRYRLNDILIENKEKCPCGSAALRLQAIEGREDDVFLFPSADDSSKMVTVYSDFIRRCLLFADIKCEYRVRQLAEDQVEVALDGITESSAVIDEIARLAEQLNFVMPNIEFAVYKRPMKRKLKRVERCF